MSCLVLSYTRHWLGERSPLGRAGLRCWLAASPPTTSNLDLQPAVRCIRSSPEFPFRFIWVLGSRLVNAVYLA
jgi:hypothetical protein